ncbi:MAG: LysR family transcriptional regulator, partial [Novosphingobium sp.]|nr:LysR family transcriptional regulator [Novosphingobium sp.]
LAVRWAEGPGDLEGTALGEPSRVTVGEGPWIAWPGDPNPGGSNAEGAPLSVGDAGQALAAARSGLGRARIPALLLDNDDPGEREPCRRAYWLVAPLPQWRQKKVKALVAFLTGG